MSILRLVHHRSCNLLILTVVANYNFTILKAILYHMKATSRFYDVIEKERKSSPWLCGCTMYTNCFLGVSPLSPHQRLVYNITPSHYYVCSSVAMCEL